MGEGLGRSEVRGNFGGDVMYERRVKVKKKKERKNALQPCQQTNLRETFC